MSQMYISGQTGILPEYVELWMGGGQSNYRKKLLLKNSG